MPRPEVYITGIAGLANNMFQVLAAIYYAEKYNAKIFWIKEVIFYHGVHLVASVEILATMKMGSLNLI